MNIILAVALILSALAVYMLVMEIFSVAFKLTGLANQKIRFQVASLFTGTGFTTSESELIVGDMRRRKIAITCMYTSHIFSIIIMGLLINFVITIFNTITNKIVFTPEMLVEWYAIVFYISLFIFVLVLVLKSPLVNRHFLSLLEKIAIRISKRNRDRNIITVIDVYGKNEIAEVIIHKIPEYVKDTPIKELRTLKKYQFLVLSIIRGKRSIAVDGDTMFAEGDVITVFGLAKDINSAFIIDEDKQEVVTSSKSATNTVTLLNNYGSNALMEIMVEEVPPEIEGLAMKDSLLMERYNIKVNVIKRDGEYITVNKDSIIHDGDEIVVFGPIKNIKHLFTNE